MSGRRVLCVDFDGVIADTCATKRVWLQKRFACIGASSSVDRSSLVPLIGIESYELMQQCIGYEDTLAAHPHTGAVEILGRLAEWLDIYVITARRADKLEWVDRWLSLHALSQAITGTISARLESKIAIASGMGASWLMDNDLRHLRVASTPMQRILFGQGETHLPGIATAPSWQSVEQFVATVSTSSTAVHA